MIGIDEVKFGDPITNVCAGDTNPHRHSYFVRRKKNTIECTDKKGRFWETYSEVIFPGHLDYAKCQELFEPMWQMKYGEWKAEGAK